jgi:hypothetical protein
MCENGVSPGGGGEDYGPCTIIVFCYEVMNRDLHRRTMYEYRCDERLKVKSEGSTRLVYTGWYGGLEVWNT